MKIKSSYIYQMADNKKAIIVYYFVIICVHIALYILSFVMDSRQYNINIEGNISGMDMASCIFVFIAGLCGFKENFGMMIQNSTSRKTMFLAGIITALTTCFGMALIDNILFTIFRGITVNTISFSYISLYEQIYPGAVAGMSAIGTIFMRFAYDFFLYLSAMAFGLLITLVFYRLGKAGKIAVGAGVPILLFIVLPIIDSAFMNFAISNSITKTLDTVYGITSSRPIYAMITGIVLFIVFKALSWGLMRRAVVKE